jgi:hypothetical protein
MAIKNELDGYHGRAGFDDRNIEDILSMLSFNVLGGGKRDREKLKQFNQAITRTIEICCTVSHPGISPFGGASVVETGPADYRAFWKNLFRWHKTSQDFPTIITLNYDLVLERSLFQVLIGLTYGNRDHGPPFKSLALNYHYSYLPAQQYETKLVRYRTPDLSSEYGTVMEVSYKDTVDLTIEILKLHGSVNFPRKKLGKDRLYNVTQSLDDPYIMPPISNKFVTGPGEGVWRTALDRLREARNITIVGYSLPSTDVYMQYFLKAAVGPNIDLNRITVIDPALHGGQIRDEMRSRYLDCFSPALRERVDFNHGCSDTSSFVSQLNDRADLFFF